MSYTTETGRAFTVLGIFTRASNAEPHLIGDLWRKFHAGEDAKAIPGRLNDTVYAVYCDYEGDYTQPYTLVIGCEVAGDAEVPEGMTTRAVEAGSFAVFPVALDGPLPAFRTWEKIWQTPLKRRYQADYDRYDKSGITIHVGVE